MKTKQIIIFSIGVEHRGKEFWTMKACSKLNAQFTHSFKVNIPYTVKDPDNSNKTGFLA